MGREMLCSKCGKHKEKVGDDCKGVICAYCIQKMAPWDEKTISRDRNARTKLGLPLLAIHKNVQSPSD